MVCDNGLCMLTYCRHGGHGAYIVISVNAPESCYSKISFQQDVKFRCFVCKRKLLYCNMLARLRASVCIFLALKQRHFASKFTHDIRYNAWQKVAY